MASLMENEGYIFANEINKIRCERLKYNVEMQGAKIVTVSNCDGRSIGDKFQNTLIKYYWMHLVAEKEDFCLLTKIHIRIGQKCR